MGASIEFSTTYRGPAPTRAPRSAQGPTRCGAARSIVRVVIAVLPANTNCECCEGCGRCEVDENDTNWAQGGPTILSSDDPEFDSCDSKDGSNNHAWHQY